MGTTQSLYPFLMTLCVCVCVCVCVCILLSKPHSQRGINQGLMQERCMEVMCQNLGRWETLLLLGIFKKRRILHVLDPNLVAESGRWSGSDLKQS